MTMYRTLYTCSTCGSEDVFCDAWASLNEEERVIRFDALHCENCEGECSVNEQEVECDGNGDVNRPIRARVRGPLSTATTRALSHRHQGEIHSG